MAESKPDIPELASDRWGFSRADLSTVYSSFLEHGRPVPDRVRAKLARGGISPEMIERFGLRYMRRHYRRTIKQMTEDFGIRLMLASGLVGVIRSEAGSQAVGVFEPYRQHRIGFLVVPFRADGHLIHIKARPIASASHLDEFGLPASLSTHRRLPHWFNADDALTGSQPDTLLLLPDEFDVMAATSRRLSAIAYGKLGNFRRDWVTSLSGRNVVLVVDESRRHDIRLDQIQALFEQANREPPSIAVAPNGASGKKMLSFLTESLTVLKLDSMIGDVNPSDLPGFDELLGIGPDDSAIVLDAQESAESEYSLPLDGSEHGRLFDEGMLGDGRSPWMDPLQAMPWDADSQADSSQEDAPQDESSPDSEPPRPDAS